LKKPEIGNRYKKRKVSNKETVHDSLQKVNNRVSNLLEKMYSLDDRLIQVEDYIKEQKSIPDVGKCTVIEKSGRYIRPKQGHFRIFCPFVSTTTQHT
jgi:hypothetical protein